MFRSVLLLVMNVVATPILAQNLEDTRNPLSTQRLFELLDDPEVVKEVAISEADLLQLRVFRAERIKQTLKNAPKLRDGGLGEQNLSTEMATKVKQLLLEQQVTEQAALEEFLTPKQMKRLREIAYRGEVAKYGLAFALKRGFLGNAIGITEEKHPEFCGRATQLQGELNRKINELLLAHESQIVNEMPIEIREKAMELLGKPFYHMPLPASDAKSGIPRPATIARARP